MGTKRRNVSGDTAYQAQLRAMIMGIQKGGLKDTEGATLYTFTPAWLAQQFKRQVTPDFRKAMVKFEGEGLIEAFWYAKGEHGLSKGYTTIVSKQTGGIDAYVNWEEQK